MLCVKQFLESEKGGDRKASRKFSINVDKR